MLTSTLAFHPRHPPPSYLSLYADKLLKDKYKRRENRGLGEGVKWKGRHCSHLKEGKQSRPDFRQARGHVPQERHNRQSALILAKRGLKSWRRAPGTAENSRFCAHKAQLYIRDRVQLYNLKLDERQDYIDGQGLSSGCKIRI